MERYKLIALLVSVKNEMQNQESEIVDDLQELIDDVESKQFEIEDVDIDYEKLSIEIIESCLDSAKEDNQNFSQVYLDCHINPELVSFVVVEKLLTHISIDSRVESCDNIYSDCIEVVFKNM